MVEGSENLIVIIEEFIRLNFVVVVFVVFFDIFVVCVMLRFIIVSCCSFWVCWSYEFLFVEVICKYVEVIVVFVCFFGVIFLFF